MWWKWWCVCVCLWVSLMVKLWCWRIFWIRIRRRVIIRWCTIAVSSGKCLGIRVSSLSFWLILSKCNWRFLCKCSDLINFGSVFGDIIISTFRRVRMIKSCKSLSFWSRYWWCFVLWMKIMMSMRMKMMRMKMRMNNWVFDFVVLDWSRCFLVFVTRIRFLSRSRVWVRVSMCCVRICLRLWWVFLKLCVSDLWVWWKLLWFERSVGNLILCICSVERFNKEWMVIFLLVCIFIFVCF